MANYQSTNAKTAYVGAHAGFRFTPLSTLTNFFTAEVTRAKNELTGSSQSLAPGFPPYFFNTKGEARFTAFAFSNRSAWAAVNTSAINLQASLLARYRLYKSCNQYATTQAQGASVPIAFSGSAQETTNRNFSLSPSITLRFKEWLSAQAGITYETYGAATGIRHAKAWLPDAGLKINLAPLAKGSGLTLWEISSTYRRQIRASERGDLLETGNGILPYFTGTVYGSASGDYTPRKNWVTSLALGVLHNRLAAKLSYRILDRTLWAEVPVSYPGGTSCRPTFEFPGSKGWRLEVKAAVVEKVPAKWTTQFLFYKEEYERMQYGTGVYSIPVDPVLFDPGKAPWRSGFRTALELRRFFLQASLLFSFNEAGTADSGTTVDDMTKFNTAFLLAGYRLPWKGKAVKALRVESAKPQPFGHPARPCRTVCGHRRTGGLLNRAKGA